MSILRRVHAPIGAAILLVTLFSVPMAHAFFSNYGPRTHAWCGWQMCQEVWRDPARLSSVQSNGSSMEPRRMGLQLE